MMTKIVYQTSPLGLYVGPVEADESPLEKGVFLIPAGCVQLAPPNAPPGKVQLWNGTTWELLDWLDGVTAYDTRTREPLQLQGMDPLPDGYTLLKPEPHQVWKDGAWVDDLPALLEGLYQEKLAALNRACSSHIEGGITSTALGKAHRYGSRMEDQVNLTGLVLLEVDADLACYPPDSETKAWVPHTREQLHQVGVDMARHKQDALQHASKLKNELVAAHQAQDLEGMGNITWSLPA